MGVPDLCTGRAAKPLSSASDPSTWSVLLWTGAAFPERTITGGHPVFFRYFNRYRMVTTATCCGRLQSRRPSGPPFQQRPFALEQLDHRIHDRAHPRQRPEVAMDQQPLVGEDLGDHAADPLQLRIGVAEIAWQDRE